MKKFIESILIFLMSIIFGISMAAGAMLISAALIWMLAMVLITTFNMLVWQAIPAAIVMLLSLLFAYDGYVGIRKFIDMFKNV